MASIFQWLVGGSGSAARLLYARIVAQSRSPAFFADCGVPDTGAGRFEVLAMHLFLVMYRLRDEGRAKRLARSLSEEAVRDFDRNLREMGVGDLSVGRKVKHLTESLYGRISAYTDGLATTDGSLAAVLRRTMFAESTAPASAVDRVASYIRREQAALAELPVDGLLEGRVEFGPPPRLDHSE